MKRAFFLSHRALGLVSVLLLHSYFLQAQHTDTLCTPVAQRAHLQWLQKLSQTEHAVTVPLRYIFVDTWGYPVGIPYPYYEKRHRQLPEIQDFTNKRGAVMQLRTEAYAALVDLQKAAQQHGVQLTVSQSYRNKSMQAQLHAQYGAHQAERVGYSEHHLFTTVDFDGVHAQSRAFLWLLEHGFEAGWIPSYYFRAASTFRKEAWHWRYVGQETAQAFWCAWAAEIYRTKIDLRHKWGDLR